MVWRQTEREEGRGRREGGGEEESSHVLAGDRVKGIYIHFDPNNPILDPDR